MIKTREGHLLIGTEYKDDYRTFIVPATFTDNGLAMAPELYDARRYTVTHVSSGLRLRGNLTKTQAKAMLLALAAEDWTFHAHRVTIAHAERVREVEAQVSSMRRTRKAA